MRRYYALFDTAVGRCGLAWGDGGILAAALPGATEAATAAALLARAGGARPDAAEAAPDGAARRIAGLLAGADDDLCDLPLDLAGIAPFEAAVYARTRAVPPGRTTTYGAIAAALGDGGAARAVGRALGRNPFPPIVPCHRVLAAGGRAGGFSAPGGLATKRRLLEIEDARRDEAPTLFDHAGLHPGGGR